MKYRYNPTLNGLLHTVANMRTGRWKRAQKSLASTLARAEIDSDLTALADLQTNATDRVVAKTSTRGAEERARVRRRAIRARLVTQC